VRQSEIRETHTLRGAALARSGTTAITRGGTVCTAPSGGSAPGTETRACRPWPSLAWSQLNVLGTGADSIELGIDAISSAIAPY
jgi:hypothetical protein